MRTTIMNRIGICLATSAAVCAIAGCEDDSVGASPSSSSNGAVINTPIQINSEIIANENHSAVLLVIDEESIDNGNPPNSFSDTDVNDQIAEVGVRKQLRYFRENVGKKIELFTGEMGDEAWHALKKIPSSWISAGPTDNGALNFLAPGPGLGAGNPDDDKEVLLDKIPQVTPLRATGLTMLIGHTILAVVYDSDVSINYSPLTGSLKGANLGLVALKVLDVRERKDASTGSLPRVTVKILDVNKISSLPLLLFVNAPIPKSSSEPFDIVPPTNSRAAEFTLAQ